MSHIRDRLIQLKNEVENTGNGAYFSKNNISKIVELLFTDLEQDEKENGWISVSERLPDIGTKRNMDILNGINIQTGMEEQRCIKLLPGCRFQNHTRRMSHDYILIRTYARHHNRRDRTCMRSDHVRQAPPRRIERRTVC